MILKIDVEPSDVVSWDPKRGRLLVKTNRHTGRAAHLNSVEGYTEEGFDTNPCKQSASIHVNARGTIQFEKYR